MSKVHGTGMQRWFDSPRFNMMGFLHPRMTQRRNFVLNMLSLIGAWWIISTLISYNSVTYKAPIDGNGVLNAKAADSENVNRRDESARLRARRDEESERKEENKVEEEDRGKEEGQAKRRDEVKEEDSLKANDKKVDAEDAVNANAVAEAEQNKEDEANENDQPNIPPPGHRFHHADSLMYQSGDPKQAGELGAPVIIDTEKLSPSEREKYDAMFTANSFNEYASEMISLHRTLPNNTDQLCKNVTYASDLPDMSVIIIFHNEAWSALLRTVHSVLDRTPDHLLKEVILVDDCSDMNHLKKPLEDYLSQYGKVRIERMSERKGLIRARLRGSSVAKGKVLTFLDSHCECMEGWAEPLLGRIAENSSNVVTPLIDTIDLQTFQYHLSNHRRLSVGGFNWGLVFNWHTLPERDFHAMKSRIDPVPSPTMAGGLFSIDRMYFEKLGTYDPGFDIWGGENLEISFKIWMCGGRLEVVPCSHVGHIFRKKSPYKWRTGVNVLQKNNVRLAEVWLDEYKEVYYERINHKLGEYGDVSSRKKLREGLQCQSFKWYLDNVFPDLFIPTEAIGRGEIRNKGNSHYCIDHEVGRNKVNEAVVPYQCHNMGGNQFWLLSKGGEIRRDEYCLDFTGRGAPVIYDCHGSKGNQLWEYNDETGRLFHPVSSKCLALTADNKAFSMDRCDENEPRQSWKFQNFNHTMTLASSSGSE